MISSLELGTKLAEAPGDPAGNRARGYLELATDRTITLVAAEEAVEDVSALGSEAGKAVTDVQSFVESRDHLVCQLLVGLGHQDDSIRRPEQVEAAVSRQLSDLRPNRVIGAERVESLVRTQEDRLEDVFRVLRWQPEGLGCDRGDVAGEPLDERIPRLGIALATAGDELCVGRRGGH